MNQTNIQINNLKVCPFLSVPVKKDISGEIFFTGCECLKNGCRFFSELTGVCKFDIVFNKILYGKEKGEL